MNILGGKIEKTDKFLLPETDMGRALVNIKKIKITPAKYPFLFTKGINTHSKLINLQQLSIRKDQTVLCIPFFSHNLPLFREVFRRLQDLILL